MRRWFAGAKDELDAEPDVAIAELLDMPRKVARQVTCSASPLTADSLVGDRRQRLTILPIRAYSIRSSLPRTSRFMTHLPSAHSQAQGEAVHPICLLGSCGATLRLDEVHETSGDAVVFVGIACGHDAGMAVALSDSGEGWVGAC
ncbi:hypothetical protein ACGFSB_21905 [Streptomyces sp. NPDC048441]|uniref:hypothetical protein n=1 Tax=Streptomyces sp. NPDC048441 TaxID=3365552 RepID=UPI00371900A3